MRLCCLILSTLIFLSSCDESVSESPRLPQIQAEPVVVQETDVNQVISIPLTLDKPSPQEIFVNYSTVASTANASSDFLSRTGQTISFASGEIIKNIEVTIVGDVFKEDDEVFFIELSSAINASIATKQISVTITDADTQEPNTDIEIPEIGYSTPTTYDGYDLVWQDEFDGDALSSDWTYEIGTGNSGWGNNELQYYREENTKVEDGYLVITAKEEFFSGRSYTSSRLITEGQQSFKFGRIDIRALLPQGQGIWPALWMLGSNFRQIGWPRCGEIDIMEMIGGQGRENNVFGTLHWDNNGTYACTCGQGSGYTLSSGIFADEFHVFSIIWDETRIRWYVDDQLYKTIDISPSGLSEFREEFFFIFNIAVGGNLPGSPDNTTQFPQIMAVDYVRVFQKN